MDLGVKGEVAIVTAGSKGLGRASAMALARSGCRVCISARTEADVQQAVKDIGQATSPELVLGMMADATEQADLDRIFKATMKKWGRWTSSWRTAAGRRPGPSKRRSLRTGRPA